MGQKSTYAVNDNVTVELYGKKIAEKVIATHDPGDGYGQSVEVELNESWHGGKKFWFEAKDLQPHEQESLPFDGVPQIGDPIPDEWFAQPGEGRE